MIPVEDAVVAELAVRLADYLHNPRVGGYAELRQAITQAAKRQKVPFSRLWDEVHRAASRRRTR